MFELFEDFINEKYVTILPNDIQSKHKYIDEVWQILTHAYADKGGNKTAKDPNVLIKKADFWKLVMRNGKITACVLYTTQKGGGRKAIAGGAAPDGIQDFLKIIQEDINMTDREVWGEVSGPMEYLIGKYNGKFISVEDAAKILKNKTLYTDENMPYHNAQDNEKIPFDKSKHYIRNIGGEPHRKTMFGNLPKNIKDNL